MANLERRVEALERISAPHEFPGWPVEEQVKEAVDKLQFYRRFHTNSSVRYAATDREITMLGIAHAWDELPDGVGEYRYPSGTVVEWTEEDEDGMQRVGVSGYISLEDLPEAVSGHFKRMDPREQPARDQRLFEMWRDEYDRGVVR